MSRAGLIGSDVEMAPPDEGAIFYISSVFIEVVLVAIAVAGLAAQRDTHKKRLPLANNP